MNASRFRQIDEIFDAVLDLPESERERFLSEKCNGDEELRGEVLELLKAENAVNFMENSAMKILAKDIADEPTIAANVWLPNQKIGTYTIEKVLGIGGMGEVYLAKDDKLKRRVALKILPAEYTTDDERIKRFQLEARAISALNHPNIVTIYDIGSFDKINYIATEFVEGSNLRDLINKDLKLKDILTIITQCCEALSAAHSAGIIHRDIKPENIMMRPDGYIKILDFGLAKLNEINLQTLTDFAKTAKGVIVGTPAYMSPEQVSDDNVDHRTDLWSLGVILYEMLTGVNPYKKENRQTTFQAILSSEPPLASSLNSEISPELDQILVKALEKDADLSYQTASDFRADLKRVMREIDSSPSLRTRSINAAKTQNIEKPRRNYLAYGLAILLVSLLGFGAWFLYSRFFNQISAPDWSKAENTQLTSLSGTEYFPSFAPDGKFFVYAGEAVGNLDIYLQRIGGNKAQNLTENSTADDTQPAFSPDGERIAFRSEREPKGIYIMGATGENARRICEFGYHPAWSPDGKEIVVSTQQRDIPNVRNYSLSKLFIINVETGANRMLIEMDAMQPSWSPDGKRIAFWFMPEGSSRREVATVSVNGGEAIVVSKDGTTNWNPVWSPDGNFLYYASDRNGNMNFWRVAINSETGEVKSEPEAASAPFKYNRHLAFSGDGKRIVYVQSEFKSNIQAINFDAKAEKTVGEPFWITTGDRQVSRPEISPDGKFFVSRLPRRTQDDIALINRETGEITDLTNDEAFDRYPRWSPDGKRIVFISDRSGSHEIWTINADATNLKQLTFNNSKGVSFPHWSPDGTQILYSLNAESFLFDWRKNANEQKPVALPIPENGARFVVWDWSLDGKRLTGTFGSGMEGIGYFSFADNKYVKISDAKEIPSWLPDSRRVIFARRGKVFILDVETKKEKEIALPQADEISTVGVSRDSNLLYFTVVSKESDIWLLDASSGH